MRHFAAPIATALLAFLVGVSTAHLRQIVARRHAPGVSATGHGVERARGKFLRRAGGAPGQYIVVLNESVPRGGVEAIATELTCSHGGEVRFVYRSALKGFSVGEMAEEAAVAVSHDPRVSYVESDVKGKLD